VVDVTVQGLVHSEDELCHATKSPDAETLIADKGYDSDAFREARRTRHHAFHSTASQASVARNVLQDLVSTAAYLNAQ
jgi:hypothetical protein